MPPKPFVENGNDPGAPPSSPHITRVDDSDDGSRKTASPPPLFPDLDAENAASPPLGMTVLGIYARGEVPRAEELPEDYQLKHLKKDQVMVRRRLRTKPISLLDDDDDDDDEDEEEDVDEEEKKEKEEGKTAKSQRSKYETAMFVPGEGLTGNVFYHTDLEEHEDDRGVYEERAVLFQSIENYQSLIADPQLSKYFLPPHIVEGGFAEGGASPIELILDDPRFGEQVIVQGAAASQVSIGDVFEVENNLSPLKVEVASPRLPCSYVDKRNGSPFGMKGVKRHTMSHGLAGWFTRVLVPGELRDGMKLVRTSHPHPKWTLTYLSKALYGEGPKRKMMTGQAYWNRDVEELRELCAIEQLGISEWKEEAQDILDYWDDSSTDEEGPKTGKAIAKKKTAPSAPSKPAEVTSEEEEGYFSRWTGNMVNILSTCCSPSSWMGGSACPVQA